MFFKSGKVYKIVLIATAAILCLCVWMVAAGLTVVSRTTVPERAALWWAGMSATSTPGSEAGAAGSPATVTSARQIFSPTPGPQAEKHTPTAVITTGPLVIELTEALATGAAGPELPPSPAATFTPEPSPSPTATATPTVTPTPTRETFNLILLGSDRNIPGKGTWRTDVMALTVIDKESDQMGVLAIPRDLYVSIPTHEPARLNTVDFLGHYTKYPGGGPALLDQTLRQNFGFGFDRFIRVDFAGFVDLIDILGGIDVEVDCPFEERFADPELAGGRLLQLSPGLQHLDGYTALMYVRSRLSTNDTDRSRRQFKVLMAMREKALKLDSILLLPQLWNNYRTTVQTDLSLTEALDLARLAYEFNPNNIHGRIIDQTMATQGKTAERSWILIPDTAKIRQAYNELLTAPRIIDIGQHRGVCP